MQRYIRMFIILATIYLVLRSTFGSLDVVDIILYLIALAIFFFVDRKMEIK